MCIHSSTTEPDMYYNIGKPDAYSLQYHWTWRTMTLVNLNYDSYFLHLTCSNW